MSPTVASGGAITSTSRRARVATGHTMPTTNNVNVNTPIATTASSPVAAPAALAHRITMAHGVDVRAGWLVVGEIVGAVASPLP